MKSPNPKHVAAFKTANQMAYQTAYKDTQWLADAMRHMLFARALDKKVTGLSRQGRVRAFTPTLGQEAAQVGVALAMRAQDWLAPTFRSTTALVTWGVPLEDLLLFWMGFEEGNTRVGRNLPVVDPWPVKSPTRWGSPGPSTWPSDAVQPLRCWGTAPPAKATFTNP